MSRRWWFVDAVALAGVLAVLAVPAGPGATRANLERVRLGMTLAEVEALMGPYEGAPFSLPGDCRYYAEETLWENQVGFTVGFDATGHVDGKCCYGEVSHSSFRDRLRRKLPRGLRKLVPW